MLDSTLGNLARLMQGVVDRTGAIHAISTVITGQLQRVQEESTYDWVEEDEGNRRHVCVGRWETFEALKASYDFDEFKERRGYYRSADIDEGVLEELADSWASYREDWLKEESSRAERRERALSACEVVAKEYGIPFDRDLALSTAQYQADAGDDWITSNC